MRQPVNNNPDAPPANAPPGSPQAPAGGDQLFRILVRGVTDYAIFLLDTEGRVTTWNAGAERITGYRPDEIIGSHFSRFYTEAERAAQLPQHALRIATESGRYESQGWRVRKDGTRFWASAVVDRIRDRDGNLVGFAKITRDMTEGKKAEAARRMG